MLCSLLTAARDSNSRCSQGYVLSEMGVKQHGTEGNGFGRHGQNGEGHDSIGSNASAGAEATSRTEDYEEPQQEEQYRYGVLAESYDLYRGVFESFFAQDRRLR